MPSVGGFGGSQGVTGTINAMNSGANIAINLRTLREDMDKTRYKRKKTLEAAMKSKEFNDDLSAKHKLASGSRLTLVSEYENRNSVQDELDYSERFNSVFDGMIDEHGSNRNIQGVLDKWADKKVTDERMYKKFQREADIVMAQAKYDAVKDSRGYLKTKTMVDPVTQKPVTREWNDVTAYMEAQALTGREVDAELVKGMNAENKMTMEFFDGMRMGAKELVSERADLAKEAGDLSKSTISGGTASGSTSGGGGLSLGDGLKIEPYKDNSSPNVREMTPAEAKSYKQALKDGTLDSRMVSVAWQKSPINRAYAQTQGGDGMLTHKLLQQPQLHDLMRKHAGAIVGSIDELKAPIALQLVDRLVSPKKYEDKPMSKELAGLLHQATIDAVNGKKVMNLSSGQKTPLLSDEERLNLNHRLETTSLTAEDLPESMRGDGNGSLSKSHYSSTMVGGKTKDGTLKRDALSNISIEQYKETIENLNKYKTADLNIILGQNQEAFDALEVLQNLMKGSE